MSESIREIMVNLENDADSGIKPNFYSQLMDFDDYLNTPPASRATPALSLSDTTPTLSLSGTTPFEGVESHLSPSDHLPGDFGHDFDNRPSRFDVRVFDGYETKETVGNHDLPLPDMDDMYKISPGLGTPVIRVDDQSIQPSLPYVDDSSTFPTRRKSTPTGTRKNITPESLVPLDATIQSRNYRLPSYTSRMKLPINFARKRARAQTSGPDEDEPSIESSILEEYAIKVKRLQNSRRLRSYLKRVEDAKVSFT